MNDDAIWLAAVGEVLEAARLEVVRRLEAHGFPLTIAVHELVVVDSPEGDGFTTQWHDKHVSGLLDEGTWEATRDDSVANLSMGLREQLEPLAQLVHQHSSLGDARTFGLFPAATGADAVLARCIHGLVIYYLRNLADLAVPDEGLVERLTGELFALMNEPSGHVRELSVRGVAVEQPMTYRDVSVRSLTGVERGHFVELNHEHTLGRTIRSPTDFVVPRRIDIFDPKTLLRTTTAPESPGRGDETRLMERLVMALRMHGFVVQGPGAVVGFEEPRWSSFGTSYQPLALDASIHTSTALDESGFRAIVELAYKIPVFDRAETSRSDIVFGRLLQGLGARHPQEGFLDLVIALEAALLHRVRQELSYRFSLYGALFLAPEQEPAETFAKLRRIYSVRSDLVHGTPVAAARRVEVAQDAVSMAMAVGRRIAEHGWPDTAQLDERALAGAD